MNFFQLPSLNPNSDSSPMQNKDIETLKNKTGPVEYKRAKPAEPIHFRQSNNQAIVMEISEATDIHLRLRPATIGMREDKASE